MRALARFAVAALPLALSACIRLGPDYQLPAEAVVNKPQAQAPFEMDHGTEVSQEDLPADWWQLYHDPKLDALVHEALARNTDLRQAYFNLRRAFEGFMMARSANDPQFIAEGSTGRGQISSQSLALMQKLPVMNLTSVLGEVSYQLDLFGKLKRATESAAASTQASQAVLDTARITVVAQVVRSYMESCHASEELEIAEHSLEIQERELEVARRLFEGGRGNEVDVSRAQAQAESLRAQIPPFESKKAAALYQLSALLGRTPGDLPPGAAACKHAPQLAEPLPVGDGAALLRRRPDIRAAERELAAATADIGVSIAEMYPEVSLFANFGYTGISDYIGTGLTRRWMFGPKIMWHFPTGVDRARVRASEAGAGAALAHFDGVVLNALRETQTLLTHYEHDLVRNQSLREARDAARDAAEYNRRLYREGRLPYLDSLDADRTLASAEATLAESESQLSMDQVNLFLALGGGWENARGESERIGEAKSAKHGSPAPESGTRAAGTASRSAH